MPRPQIYWSGYFFLGLRFHIGNLVEHAVFREIHIRIEAEVLVYQELPFVAFAVDEDDILIPAVYLPTAIFRLFLDKTGENKVIPFLNTAEYQVQSIVIQETVIGVAEHDVLTVTMIYAIVAGIGQTTVWFDNVVDLILVILKKLLIKNYIIAIVDNQNAEIIEINAMLNLNAVKKEFALFPRFVVVRYYNFKLFSHKILL